MILEEGPFGTGCFYGAQLMAYQHDGFWQCMDR